MKCINGDGREVAPGLRNFINEVQLCQHCYDRLMASWVKMFSKVRRKK